MYSIIQKINNYARSKSSFLVYPRIPLGENTLNTTGAESVFTGAVLSIATWESLLVATGASFYATQAYAFYT